LSTKYVNQRKNFPVSQELTQSFFGRLTEKVDIIKRKNRKENHN